MMQKDRLIITIMVIVLIGVIIYANTAIAEAMTGNAIHKLGQEFPGISIVIIVVGCILAFMYVKKKHEINDNSQAQE